MKIITLATEILGSPVVASPFLTSSQPIPIVPSMSTKEALRWRMM